MQYIAIYTTLYYIIDAIIYIIIYISMIFLPGKGPHKQVGMGRVVTSGSLGGVMFRTLAQNARDVGLIPTLGAIFPIFITPTTLVSVTRILYKLPDECSSLH